MQFEDLDEFQTAGYTSGRVPPNSMPLPEIDGYLTGITMTPLVTSVRDWILKIWNGNIPSFQSQEELDAVVEAIRQRKVEIGAQLDDLDPCALDPIFFERNGEVIVTDWADGFMQAVAVYRQAWQPLLGDPEGQEAIAPIAAHSVDENGTPPLGLAIPNWRELQKLAPDSIPEAVVAIEQFWLEHDRLAEAEERMVSWRHDPHNDT